MDTSTHVLTGVGLAGLSYLDPTISSHPELLIPMLFCTILGSNAPDIDYIYKYKGNDVYLQKHRGMSHSLYAQGFLSLVIAGIATMANGGQFFSTFLIWTLLAMILHVLFDICNIYGTQAFRPFTQKWLALNLLTIIDPFITALHLGGIIFWFAGYSSGMVFLIVYVTTLLYLLIRYMIQIRVKKALLLFRESGVTYTLLPTFSLNRWKIVASFKHHYKLGKYENNRITWSKVLMKASEHNEIIAASRKHIFIDYLRMHTDYLHAKVKTYTDGYEVQWFDLRYQSKFDEPFVAVVKLDTQLNLIQCEVKRGFMAVPEKA
ncbi:metal-dependent hydrolase [Niallia endozanthoxylica]|uniref:Metal-dependent hydrolase n=1 Tax=Niallia endozanthoxylica TaxID=2036016 RepID=A0A5J5HSW8_9BACI|nr:metal-dependent hydrolase [Niallia endozanthoxylica]KAA9023981.1 metal-dependent hydrolase [Niallia endozanthoxylica]